MSPEELVLAFFFTTPASSWLWVRLEPVAEDRADWEAVGFWTSAFSLCSAASCSADACAFLNSVPGGRERQGNKWNVYLLSARHTDNI